MISFELSQDEQSLAGMAREFAETRLRPVLRECEAGRGVPEALGKEFFELGLATLALPEELGGVGLGPLSRAIVWEELAWGDLGAALAMPGPGLAAHALMVLADGAQRAEALEPFAGRDGFRRRGALALFEPGFGGPPEFRTVARRDGPDYVIDGKKAMVLNGGLADLVVVVATLDPEAGWDGLAAFLLPGDTPGLAWGPRRETTGLETATYADLVLDGCRVPAGAKLAGEGAEAFGRFLAELRIEAAAQAVGLARAAQEHAARYATQRKAFGQYIAEFQGVSFMVADSATEVDAARWLTWRAGWALGLEPGAGTGHPPAGELAAAAHAQALAAARFVTDRAVQVLGGHGYVDDHPVEKWMRDARAHAVLNAGGNPAWSDARLADAALGLTARPAPKGVPA